IALGSRETREAARPLLPGETREPARAGRALRACWAGRAGDSAPTAASDRERQHDVRFTAAASLPRLHDTHPTAEIPIPVDANARVENAAILRAGRRSGSEQH